MSDFVTGKGITALPQTLRQQLAAIRPTHHIGRVVIVNKANGSRRPRSLISSDDLVHHQPGAAHCHGPAMRGVKQIST